MPHRGAGALLDAHAEEARGDLEQAGEHARQREVGAQLLLGDREALALQPLGVEADVPGGELAAGEGLQFGELRLRGGARGAGELVQEFQHLIRAVRHARGERVVRVVVEIQQARGLVAALEDLLHHRRVVPAPGVRALVRGARGPGFVERAPQRLDSHP